MDSETKFVTIPCKASQNGKALPERGGGTSDPGHAKDRFIIIQDGIHRNDDRRSGPLL